MVKKRIYELAKEKGVSNKEILWILDKLKIKVKSYMSALEKEQVEKINNYYILLEEKVEKEKENKVEFYKNINNKKIESNNLEDLKISQILPEDKITNNKILFNENKNINKKKESSNKNIQFNKKKYFIENRYNIRRQRKQKVKTINNEAIQEAQIKKISIGEEIQVKDLGAKINKTASEVIKKLIGLGVMATINQYIDFDTASLIASEFGVEDIEFKSIKRQTQLAKIEDDPDSLRERPPIIAVMGHVDHGKTSLLDAIRSTNVIATEAGGITQHIGAYQINYKGKKITFIDTPGHAAFTAMRARGAKITDIAILVVAADDGVMPQTIEAIEHAKSVKAPIIVAINKIDKPNSDPNRVMQQLSEHGLISEEWGGNIIFVKISAKQKTNIDELIEMILLLSEVEDLKSNYNRLAEGFVLESKLNREKGAIVTLLIIKGTLKVGDMILSGESYGKVRAIINDSGKRLKQAGPSTPVEVLGLSNVPGSGDIFQVVKDEKLASHLASERKIVKKEEIAKKNQKISLENLFEKIKEDNLKEFNIIIKGDTHGSVEALIQSIRNIETKEIKVNIINDGVGAISETDVKLAIASNALIIGFNVRPDINSKKLAKEENVDIRLYRIIYEVIENIKQAISGLLDPDIKENEIGLAEVRQLIKIPKLGIIAGAYIIEGKITSVSNIRVVRDGLIIYEGKINSLKRFKDEVKEVSQGYECGISIEDFKDIKEKDVLEAYLTESVARKIE